MTSTVIKPTVGRRVWFRPSAAFLASNPILTQFNPEQPMDAGIVYVHHDHMVNLIVTDHVGKTMAVPSVPLLAGQYVAGEDADVYCCCEWMPYQKGQAAKAASTTLPVVDPGPDSLERAMESKTYQDGTTAFGPAPLPDVSPALWAKPLAKEVPELTVSLSDLGLEREIQAKADKGPRVTPTALKDEIVSVHCFTAANGVRDAETWPNDVPASSPLNLLTFCVLVLRNGFTVHGVSACASPENYNKEIGERIARENAEREIWPLLGFRLRDELARPVLTEGDVAADAAGTCRPDNHTSACTACKRA